MRAISPRFCARRVELLFMPLVAIYVSCSGPQDSFAVCLSLHILQMAYCADPCCSIDQSYCQCRGCTAQWCYPRNADGTAAPTCRNTKAKGHQHFPKGQQFCKFCKMAMIANNEVAAKAAAKTKAKAKATPAPPASAPEEPTPAPTPAPAGAATAPPSAPAAPTSALIMSTLNQVINLTGRMQEQEGRQAAHEEFVRGQFEMVWAMMYRANPMAHVLGLAGNPVGGNTDGVGNTARVDNTAGGVDNTAGVNNTAATSDADVGSSTAAVRGSSIGDSLPTVTSPTTIGSPAEPNGSGDSSSGGDSCSGTWVVADKQWQ